MRKTEVKFPSDQELFPKLFDGSDQGEGWLKSWYEKEVYKRWDTYVVLTEKEKAAEAKAIEKKEAMSHREYLGYLDPYREGTKRLWDDLEPTMKEAIESGAADSFPDRTFWMGQSLSWGKERTDKIQLNYFEWLYFSVEDALDPKIRHADWVWTPVWREVHTIATAPLRLGQLLRVLWGIWKNMIICLAVSAIGYQLGRLGGSGAYSSNLTGMLQLIFDGAFFLGGIGAVIYFFASLGEFKDNISNIAMFFRRGKIRRGAAEALQAAYRPLRFYTLWSEKLHRERKLSDKGANAVERMQRDFDRALENLNR